jgi:hypothetical protein
MVTAGAYENYHVIRVFEDKEDAEQFALEYNATTPRLSKDDMAEVEEVDFVPARQELKAIEVVR